MAKSTLYFFDKNFDGLGYNSTGRHLILRDFLLGNPMRRLYLLAHDPHYLSTRCPRMLDLLHRFGQGVFFYQTLPSLHHISAPFAIADGEHLVRKFHFDDPRGLLATHDSASAQALKTRFMEMWAASHPATSVTRLSL